MRRGLAAVADLVGSQLFRLELRIAGEEYGAGELLDDVVIKGRGRADGPGSRRPQKRLIANVPGRSYVRQRRPARIGVILELKPDRELHRTTQRDRILRKHIA